MTYGRTMGASAPNAHHFLSRARAHAKKALDLWFGHR